MHITEQERPLCAGVKKDLFVPGLNKEVRSSFLYSKLIGYDFLALIFFKIYYQGTKIDSNIEYFIENLLKINLKIKGSDLKRAGLKPNHLFGLVLNKVLSYKIDKGLANKEKELEQAVKIYNQMESKGL